jgi:hypothetical protein
MSSLILNETTLFYLNLSTTAPDISSEFNTIKSWTTRVARVAEKNQSSNNVVPSGSPSIMTLVPSKRTTPSSSAVVSKTHAQPEKKKIKLDNRDFTTSMVLGEDEAGEREAAISSPIKGNQRINSKVCRMSHHDRMLTSRQAIVKVENMTPPPKRSGANKKYTNADLPGGAMNGNTWRKKVIPTYIQYLAGQNVKETWTIEDSESVTLLQTIWNFIYGAELPHTIKVNGPAFSIVSFFFALLPTPTVLLGLGIGRPAYM